MITIIANGFESAAEPGDSVLAALRRAGRMIQSICGGRGMCGTCRVAIDPAWLGALGAPAAGETRLLRVLKGGGPSHRLACQAVLDERHDGLLFSLDPPPTRVILQETKT